jgi:hypothetical protein
MAINRKAWGLTWKVALGKVDAYVGGKIKIGINLFLIAKIAVKSV